MRVFLTGATGFVGTSVAGELIGAGHQVLGVARTDEGAAALASRGVEPHRGDLTDAGSFIAGALACDATVHCAFIHDFSRFAENIEIEQQTVAAMLDALEGSGKPFIATSGMAGQCQHLLVFWPNGIVARSGARAGVAAAITRSAISPMGASQICPC